MSVRGVRVRVRIVVPSGHTATRIGRWAAHGLYGELLAANSKIHEYQPTMMHCKVLVIDGMSRALLLRSQL